jgi:hypothetical protein
MDPRISLKIDIRAGVIELDAPAESFDEAVARTQELASSLDFSTAAAPAQEARAEAPQGQDAPADQQRPQGQASRPRTRSGTKASSARTGRIGSFEEVRGLLTEEQEIALRAFFSEKAPSEQGHQALVAIVKGEQLLERKGFTYNEIYTLMWLAGVKDLPKALDVVLLKLAQEQMVVRDENGYAAKFVGRNFVENDLPRAA